MTKLRYLIILVLTASVGLVLGSNIIGRWLIQEVGDTVLNSRKGTLTVLLVLLSCFIFAVVLMPIIYGSFDKSRSLQKGDRQLFKDCQEFNAMTITKLVIALVDSLFFVSTIATIITSGGLQTVLKAWNNPILNTLIPWLTTIHLTNLLFKKLL